MLERLTLPELRRLLILTDRPPEAIEREVREKFGAQADAWNIPKAAASVREDIVKLISQKEREVKRDAFGAPQPKGADEMLQAMEEKGVDGSEVYASLSKSEDDSDPIWKGWCAEVRVNDSGEDVFMTIGYGEDQAALIADLKAVGIHDYSEE